MKNVLTGGKVHNLGTEWYEMEMETDKNKQSLITWLVYG